MTTTNTSNPQSANKWAPAENDIESQIMQLALITQSDLNFLAQMFNLLSYSEQGRKRYHDFLLRENKKRWYFSTQVPTHELKAFVENFKAELDDFDKENLSQEDQQKRLQEMQELKDKLANLFVEMNTQLKALGLDPVDTLPNMVKIAEEQNKKQ